MGTLAVALAFLGWKDSSISQMRLISRRCYCAGSLNARLEHNARALFLMFRRGVRALLVPGLLAACASSAPTQQDGAARTQMRLLEALAPIGAPLEDTLPLSIAAIKEGESQPNIIVTGRGRVPKDAADRPVRIASISKLTVAIVAMQMVERGELSLAADVSDILGWQLRNPSFPDEAITVGQLLSHTSSLTDGTDYTAPLPQTLEQLMGDARFYQAEHRPGGFFLYANINYGVLGTVMEAAAGQRFDQLMQQRLFAPAGLDIGFNWHGVTLARQAQAIPAGRYEDAPLSPGEENTPSSQGIVIAIDGEPVGPSPSRAALQGYVPGTNATVFSPQGGLRASLKDLLVLGEIFTTGGQINGVQILAPSTVKTMTKAAWVLNEAEDNGDSYGGLMRSFGLGVHIYQPGNRCFETNGARYLGHFGEAYGLIGGLLVDPKAKRTVAYLFPYTPTNAEDALSDCSGLYRWEERFFKEALAP